MTWLQIALKKVFHMFFVKFQISLCIFLSCSLMLYNKQSWKVEFSSVACGWSQEGKFNVKFECALLI